jgi:hypothetical protein
MSNLNSIIRSIMTATGKANDAYWHLARFVRDSQTKADATYATVHSAWQAEAEAARATDGRAVIDAPSESSVRQLGASAKLWGSVADGTHSPYHAYAWRSLAYNVDDDGKRTPKVGDDLQAAWDSIPASRPKPKPTAPTATVSVKLPKSLAERLQGMADAAGVDVADVILALLPDA